jgi:hypothetical protein
MVVDVRLVRLGIDVVTDLHGVSLIECRLTSAISGGAQSARRLLIETIGSCWQFLQAA